jgi:hypothetical protein
VPKKTTQASRYPIAAVLLLLATLASCTLAPLARYRGVRTDKLTGAPFYVNYSPPGSIDGDQPVVCPDISIDPRTVFTFGLYDGREVTFAPLLAAMNERLGRMARCRPLRQWDPLEEGAPDLYAGSGEAESAPYQYVRSKGESRPPMILTTSFPSEQWREQHSWPQTRDPKYLLILRIGIAEYPKSRKLLFDEKVVLGTRNEVDLSFLGRNDSPVEVVQLTGMLLDRDGNVLRVGAEGIAAKRPNFLLDMFGFTENYRNYDLGTLPTEQRRDLPGAPLKWEVALDQLMVQMLKTY